MQKIQNGFIVIYQETKNNPLAPFKSFTIKTKNKNSAIEYAAKFANFNHFKIIKSAYSAFFLRAYRLGEPGQLY